MTVAALLLAACGDDDAADKDESTPRAEGAFVTVDDDEVDRFTITTSAPGSESTSALAGETSLSVDSTWQWQLQGDLDSSFEVDVYDVDLFETSAALVDELHADSRIVICYFSAGSYEGWRPDADGYAAADLGRALDGFEDERWLDVRSGSVREVNEGRLDRAVELGCDGAEPDNVDGYVNDTGFDLTYDHQLAFNRQLADAAHDRGLLVGLKNDLDQIPDLVDAFDFAVNEQCHEHDECNLNEPFIDAGKPVFNAEYADEFVDDPDSMCAASFELRLRTLVLPLDLDGSFRISCDDR